jgi:hypothetical protein
MEPELGLRPKGDEVKVAVAKRLRNHDDAEMDCLAIAIGKLDVCLQSAGRQPFAKAKMKSVNSRDRPLHGARQAGAASKGG